MNNADLLVVNAKVFTLDAEDKVFNDGAIAVANGQIVALGPSQEVQQRIFARNKLDAKGKVIFPGLINTHSHLFQTFMRGLGKDKPLIDWLNHAVRRVMPYLDEEACYLAAMVGCMEAVRTGTTTILDYMYANVKPRLADVVIKAFEDLKIRGVLGRGMCDLREFPGGGYSLTWEPIDKCLEDAERLYSKYKDNRLIQIFLAPAALWNMTKQGLDATAKFSERYGLPITMHLLESKFDDEYCLAQYGIRALPFLAQQGLLNSNFIAVHGVYLNSEDIGILKQYQVKLSYNPTSNMILGAGVAPVPELLLNGIKVGLATDGAASNDSQNMLEVMKNAALLQKISNLNAAALGAKEVLLMATRQGAEVLGMEKDIGSLEVGKKADFIILNYLSPNMVPCYDCVATLVYCGNNANIDSVIVDGKFILESGRFTCVDEDEILRQATQKACQLAKQAGVA